MNYGRVIVTYDAVAGFLGLLLLSSKSCVYFRLLLPVCVRILLKCYWTETPEERVLIPTKVRCKDIFLVVLVFISVPLSLYIML